MRIVSASQKLQVINDSDAVLHEALEFTSQTVLLENFFAADGRTAFRGPFDWGFAGAVSATTTPSRQAVSVTIYAPDQLQDSPESIQVSS